jgi:hypothetical protein
MSLRIIEILHKIKMALNRLGPIMKDLSTALVSWDAEITVVDAVKLVTVQATEIKAKLILIEAKLNE